MNKTIKLKKKATIHIEPTEPFSFEGTFFKPSHFPSRLVLYDGKRIYQAVEVGNDIFGIVVSDDSNNIGPKIKIDIYASTKPSKELKKAIELEIIARYNLDGLIGDFIDELKNDELLAGPIKRWGGMRPSIAYSLYGFLMVATVLQNATVRRTVQMMDVLLEKFGTKLKFAGQEVYAIWKPEDMENVPEEELRGLKIGYRAKNIKRISHSFAVKEISENELRKI